jgi:hypothetical protein
MKIWPSRLWCPLNMVRHMLCPWTLQGGDLCPAEPMCHAKLAFPPTRLQLWVVQHHMWYRLFLIADYLTLKHLKSEDDQVICSAEHHGVMTIGGYVLTVVSAWPGLADHSQYHHWTLVTVKHPSSQFLNSMNKGFFVPETPVHYYPIPTENEIDLWS